MGGGDGGQVKKLKVAHIEMMKDLILYQCDLLEKWEMKFSFGNSMIAKISLFGTRIQVQK